MNPNELEELRAAVAASPENVHIRKMLAKALIAHQRFEEAEVEYKEALKMAPNDANLKIGLADAFAEQDKISLGLVIIEEMMSQPAPPKLAWWIYAKLLLKSRDYKAAKDAYDKAMIIAPELEDPIVGSEIYIHAPPDPNEMDEEEEDAFFFDEEFNEQNRIRLGGFQPPNSGDAPIEFERPKMNFDHVGGMDAVKEEIKMKIIHPLQHPEIYKAYGKKVGGGILLYGPPGCGKTHLARATAGQIQSNFIPVGISDILDLYLGQSERNLHAIFERARRLTPSVLFFDEADALGANRTDMRQSAGRHLINQFLAEMDGVQYDNEGVLILAATNTPWHLDPAFRRPGRFDRIIFVPPPDEKAREEILKIHLKEKPIQDIDYGKIAKQTKDYSGADLQAIIDIAIEQKLAASIKSGVPQPLVTADLLQAIKRHKPTTAEWFTTAKNYALFSNESGLYDDILNYLNIKK